MVKDVFNSVANNYDVMNDLSSMGVHRLWKDYFVSSMGPLRHRKIFNEKGQSIQEVPLKIIDVAGGTGDISFRIHDKAKKEAMFGPLPVDITVSDINASMLEVGKQ